jgi:pimeloyl-ACP methyl ester carboxylesterase
MNEITHQLNALESIRLPGNILARLWRKLRGKPTQLLFLHGIHDPYQNSIDILQGFTRKGITVCAVNMPGHGHSGFTGLPINWDNLVLLVDAFVQQQQLHDFLLTGFSMGGGIALKYTERFGRKLAGLILMAPFCEPPHALDALPRIIEAEQHAQRVTLNRHNLHKPPPLRGDSLGIMTHYLPMFLHYAIDYSRITLPTKVFIHDEDTLIPRHTLDSLISNLPQAEAFVMLGFYHNLYFTPDVDLAWYTQTLVKYSCI